MQTNDLRIINTTPNDWDMVMGLFQKAMGLQGKKGYKVWAGKIGPF